MVAGSPFFCFFANKNRFTSFFMTMPQFPYSTILTVPFEDPRLASITAESLKVDQELSVDKVSRCISVNDRSLIVTFAADSLRMLRVSINGFMDSLILVTRTLDTFA
ncbi:transcription factor Pcc1-domain-containing protein [Coemansia spiralis]|nr:transcription factor Pcc1-domain-containing protein [Coemansia spiralis]